MNRKEEALEKLQSIIKTDPGTWKEDVPWRRENRTWKKSQISFVLKGAKENSKRFGYNDEYFPTAG